MVGLWAVGVPALYVYLLSTSRGKPQLTILTDGYRSNTSMWEIVVVGQKLFLVGFVALITPGSWNQLFIGTVISLFALVLQARMIPYRTPSDNFFAFFASLALVGIFVSSLGIHFQAVATELEMDSYLQTAMLFMSTILVLVTALLFLWVELRDSRKILLVRATEQPPHLTLAEDKFWYAGANRRSQCFTSVPRCARSFSPPPAPLSLLAGSPSVTFPTLCCALVQGPILEPPLG